MVEFRRRGQSRWVYKSSVRNSFFILLIFSFIRFSKGTIFLDAYALFTRPFWPGTAQKEWILKGHQLEQKIKINLLEKDNTRLRNLLSLESFNNEDQISAAVISRQINGWWQQLELNKGSMDGVNVGNAVSAPGGLIGIIYSVTPSTARVKLLTAPGSKIGVWIERSQRHGMLVGMGTNRPKLSFLNKDTDVLPGDVVTTSPASTLLPPNLPIGVVQSLDKESAPAPFAIIQLIASPEAIDWVQILRSS
tara:strand:- start:9640 stop:10386 length:747 start_codon:yes stop_codon:yes gene_type:complete